MRADEKPDLGTVVLADPHDLGDERRWRRWGVDRELAVTNPPPNEAPCEVHFDEEEGADWCFTHNNFAPHGDQNEE